MTNTLRLALVQRPALTCEEAGSFARAIAGNRQRAVCCIEEAARQGADLVVFPELWTHSYAAPYPGAFDEPFAPSFAAERRAFVESAVSFDSAYGHTLQTACATHRVGALVTALSQGTEKPHNTAWLIGRDGQRLLTYHKVHTCSFSMEALMAPGDRFATANFDGVKMGVMICFDREFPESARELMLQGAELILVPNACPMDPARLAQLSTRAFENMTIMAMANYPGPGWGKSCVFTPQVFTPTGEPKDNGLFLAGEDEGIFYVDLDIASLRLWRQHEVWGKAYRRPQAYRHLTGRE